MFYNQLIDCNPLIQYMIVSIVEFLLEDGVSEEFFDYFLSEFLALLHAADLLE